MVVLGKLGVYKSQWESSSRMSVQYFIAINSIVVEVFQYGVYVVDQLVN